MAWNDFVTLFAGDNSDNSPSHFFEIKKSLGLKTKARHLISASVFSDGKKCDSIFIRMAKQLHSFSESCVFRIYLAENLEEEAETFLDAGCEVVVMEGPLATPGMARMWSFLALEEKEKLVTITDISRKDQFLLDVQRTEMVAEASLGGWRLPYTIPAKPNEVGYRPIDPRCFGSCRSYPMRGLMEAFVKETLAGQLPPICHPPWGGERSIAKASWPEEGFESWFLMSALYPRMAAEGFLTVVPGDGGNLTFLPLDIEYCTWANPSAEVVLGPPPAYKIPSPKPWDGMESGPALHARPGARVFRRERRRTGPMQRIYREEPHEEVLALEKHEGDLKSWLERCAAEGGAHVGMPRQMELAVERLSPRTGVEDSSLEGSATDCGFQSAAAEWWIDVNPGLRVGKHGADLFLDRCYAEEDVVVCGSFFVRLTEEMAHWARENGGKDWEAEKIIRVPKLEGPATLWRAEFGKKFLEEWKAAPEGIRAELILKAKMERGQARVRETTAGRMGWKVR